MNKADFVERLMLRAKIQKKQAEQAVNLLFDGMKETLAHGDRVEIRGFGSFVCKHYPAYQGRNPKTGEIIHVPEKRLPVFKAGKELRARVDKAE